MANVLCVTGMHRSGTSLTASWLAHCGLIVHDGVMVGAAAGNPHGHFEDKEFVDLHQQQLLRWDPRSRGWIVRGRSLPGTDDDFARRAQRLIDQRNAKYELWGWKDPRTVLFLEAWKQLLPELKVLLLWRACRDVVGSLLARKAASTAAVMRITTLEAVRTWASYNRRVLEYRRAHPDDSLLVPISRVIAGDRELLPLINDRFGLRLSHHPVSTLRDDTLLKPRRRSWLARGAESWFDTAALERELAGASETMDGGG